MSVEQKVTEAAGSGPSDDQLDATMAYFETHEVGRPVLHIIGRAFMALRMLRRERAALAARCEAAEAKARRYDALEAAWQAGQLTFTQGKDLRFVVGPPPPPYVMGNFDLVHIADTIADALDAAIRHNTAPLTPEGT